MAFWCYFLDIEISLVEDELQSSVQATPLVTPTSPVSLSDHSSSPASSCSSDSTLILKSTKNRKKGQEELDRDDAKQVRSKAYSQLLVLILILKAVAFGPATRG